MELLQEKDELIINPKVVLIDGDTPMLGDKLFNINTVYLEIVHFRWNSRPPGRNDPECDFYTSRRQDLGYPPVTDRQTDTIQIERARARERERRERREKRRAEAQ